MRRAILWRQFLLWVLDIFVHVHGYQMASLALCTVLDVSIKYCLVGYGKLAMTTLQILGRIILIHMTTKRTLTSPRIFH